MLSFYAYMWLMHLTSIHCYQQEEADKSHSSLGINAEPANGSPATSMPQPLPYSHIEQSSAMLGASMPLPGEVKETRLPFLPTCLQSRDA